MSQNVEKVSDAELEVLKVLWEAGTPLSYPEISEQLSARTGWAKTTVKTLLGRLVEKGFLRREKAEMFFYSPTIAEQDFTKEKTKSFLQKFYGGNVKGLVSALVHQDFISGEELEELEDFWNRNKH